MESLQNEYDHMDFGQKSVLEMAWKWILSYFSTVVLILVWNDAFNMDTLTNFSTKFKQLVDELSMYFRPCGFPIELVTRFCMDKLQINRMVSNSS